MKYYQLYMIRNKINHKVYIGQTHQHSGNGYELRFKGHLWCVEHGVKTKLYNAMRKYGIDNFELSLLLHDVPENQINHYECLWIKKFNSLNCGYNMTIGGNGTIGYEFSDVARAKCASASKKFWDELKKDPEAYYEFITRRGLAERGKYVRESTRKKQSEIAKLKTGSKNSFYGRHHTEATKRAHALKVGKRVVAIDVLTDVVAHEFNTMVEATNWLIELGKTRNKCANSLLVKVCKYGGTAYGYKWKYQI